MNARTLPPANVALASATIASSARTLADDAAAALPAAAPERQANVADSAAWIDICALADIAPLGSRVVQRAGAPAIAIFRTATDAVFALDDRCPHKGGPLSQGIVFGERVACPLHNWTIELASGSAVAPDQGCTARHAVRVVGGRVQLDAAAFVSTVAG